MAFTIKKGDTLPVLEATLTTGPTSGSQTAVNLTSASVVLVLKPASGGSATRKTAAVVSAPAGTVEYEWVGGDTATAVVWNAEWEVTFSGGAIQTFPNDGYFQITVAEDLG
jgi:hypothetical protein